MATMLRCLNWKVLTGLGAVAVLILLIAPHAGGVVPLLAVLACPLSMVAMMWSMRASPDGTAAHGSRGSEARIAELEAQIAALEADREAGTAHIGDHVSTR